MTDRPGPDNPALFWRGARNAALIVIPFWSLIIWLILRIV